MAEQEIQSPEERYQEPLEKLVKYGRFNILDATVDGLKNLNPSKRALRDIFINESSNKEKRLELKERLKKWHELLSNAEDVEKMIETAQKEVEESQGLLNTNVKKGLEETRELERSYRTMALFFKNSKTDKIKNLTLLNASMEQLSNPDMDQFRGAVKEKLRWAYGTVGKSDNYSLMVVPGFLGSNKVLREWSQMADDNKVMLITDFRDMSDHESVIDLFDSEEYPDVSKTNVIMTCNWLIGREAQKDVGEEESISVPPSAALAGKIYNPEIPISQPIAGKEYGTLENVDGVRFKLLQEHIGQLDQRGLVPMVREFGGVMPYSARTLYNGDDVGLKTYSVVMVFDWVGKVITDFLNRAAFQNASPKMLNDYRTQIVKFLNSIKGNGKLIKNFAIKKFEPDTENGQPDRILVHVVLDPYFPAKSFAIKMDGTAGEGIDNYVWNTKVEEIG